MKKFLALLMAFLMMFGTVAFADGEAESAEPALTKDLAILFTSDVHCGVDYSWGYAGIAAIRDQIAKDKHVILVDNGDAIQGEPVGTMTEGSAVVDIMEAAGYEVAIPGNHEFDYGMDNFLDIAENSAYPYISCNFTYEGEPVFDPYVIKEFDNIKVAFVGVTTPKTFTSSTPTYFQDENGEYAYGFCEDETGEALYAAVQSAVDAAREEGADYVILQAHLGIEAEASPWQSTDVILNTTGIDAVLDGHSHSEISCELVKNKDGKETILAACGSRLKNIGYLNISTEGELTSGLYTWDCDVSIADILTDTPVGQAVEDAMGQLDEALQEVVAASQVDLTIYAPEKDTEGDEKVRIIRNMETNLGDLCADAYRAVGGADIGLVNGGGIRVSIPAGDITLNDVLKVHPFGNALCVVEATGAQIVDALEWNSRTVPGETGGFLQVSGLTYEIHAYIESSCTADDKGNFTGVEGEYRVRNVMVNGEPIDLEKTYTVASHNYMLKSGGDGTNMFMGCNVLLDEIMLDNQVLITYVGDFLNGTIGEEYENPYGSGRIVIFNEKP
mgnify:FL=1